MKPHQICLQAKVKHRNEPKQAVPKSEHPSRSLEMNAIWRLDTEVPTIFNKSCTYISFKCAVKHRQQYVYIEPTCDAVRVAPYYDDVRVCIRMAVGTACVDVCVRAGLCQVFTCMCASIYVCMYASLRACVCFLLTCVRVCVRVYVCMLFVH